MRKPLFFLSFILLSLAACQSGEQSETPSVYATCYPIFDLATKVAGGLIEVKNLVPPGGEPHEYEPTPRELGKMCQADALLYNGLGMESWLEPLFKNPSSQEVRDLAKKSYCLSDGIETLKIEGVDDPHIWLNPKNAIAEMDKIRGIFSSIDPENASTYALNYENEAKRLVALDEDAKAVFSALTNKNLVVAHAAFGYMADAYGLTQHYVSGLSPDEEPTARDLEALIQTIQETEVKTIYTEELFTKKIAETLAAATNCEIALLYTIETLDEDQLTAGEDYISLYRKNIATIQEGGK